jgi:2-polyprenyl-3-methyl-5-hydroxy-6-metoxy-1,4-benzoquinol methylase
MTSAVYAYWRSLSLTQIKAAYNAWAKTYDTDRNITRDLDAATTRKVLGEMSFCSVLEFGCGTGKNSEFFARIGKNVLALDFSDEMIAVAKRSISADHIRFKTSDIEDLWPTARASHDLISCNLILQHVADLDFVFAEAARSSKAGGLIFVSELHPVKKYQGSMARFESEGKEIAIPAFNHQISHYLQAASRQGLKLLDLNEWWHEDDAGKQPRLVTFIFER